MRCETERLTSQPVLCTGPVSVTPVNDERRRIVDAIEKGMRLPCFGAVGSDAAALGAAVELGATFTFALPDTRAGLPCRICSLWLLLLLPALPPLTC